MLLSAREVHLLAPVKVVLPMVHLKYDSLPLRNPPWELANDPSLLHRFPRLCHKPLRLIIPSQSRRLITLNIRVNQHEPLVWRLLLYQLVVGMCVP